jgi:hypothetical protein
VLGDPVTLVDGLRMNVNGAAQFSSARNSGILVYVPGRLEEDSGRELVWVTRDGSESSLGAPSRLYASLQLSPDGTRIALGLIGGHWQIATRGGSRPRWSRDGRELFYMDTENKLAVIRVHAGIAGLEGTGGDAALSFDSPKRLFEAAYFTGSVGPVFDVSADGQRFLMMKQAPSVANPASSGMVVALGWKEELLAKLPAK